MFKKFKNLQINWSTVAFISYVFKVLIWTPSYPEALVMLVISCTYGYINHLQKFRVVKLEDSVEKDLLEVKSALSKLNIVRSTDKLNNKRYF